MASSLNALHMEASDLLKIQQNRAAFNREHLSGMES